MKKALIFCAFFFLFFSLFFSTNVVSQSCGNSKCDTGENSCTCAQDCGSCDGNVSGSACRQYACQQSICSIVTISNCCGNGSCELKEDYGNCPVDCIPKNIEIGVISPPDAANGQKLVRGEEVLFKLRITADGRPIASPDISTKGDFGEIRFFNDGKHGDENAADNVFAGTVTVPNDWNAGTKTAEITAEFLKVSSTKKILLEIDPSLEIKTYLPPSIELGQNIDFFGQVLKKGNPEMADFMIKIFVGDKIVFSKNNATDSNGSFNETYRSSLLDRQGNWKLEISALDEFGNFEKIEATIDAAPPKKIEPLNIEVAGDFKREYLQGDEINFILRLVNGSKELVKNAEVLLNLPDKKQVSLVEIEPGKYAVSIPVVRQYKRGFNVFGVEATDTQNGLEVKASKQFVLNVAGRELKIEVLEPSELMYKVGEKMELKVRVTDFDGEPVNDAAVRALVNGGEVMLSLSKIGVYSVAYEILPKDEGGLKIEFSAVDAAQNMGLKGISVNSGGKGFFFDISQNFALFGGVMALAIAIGVFSLVFLRLRKNEKGLLKKIGSFEDAQKRLQEKYFHEHSLSKEEYKSLMEKNESGLKKAKSALDEFKTKK